MFAQTVPTYHLKKEFTETELVMDAPEYISNGSMKSVEAITIKGYFYAVPSSRNRDGMEIV